MKTESKDQIKALKKLNKFQNEMIRIQNQLLEYFIDALDYREYVNENLEREFKNGPKTLTGLAVFEIKKRLNHEK